MIFLVHLITPHCLLHQYRIYIEKYLQPAGTIFSMYVRFFVVSQYAMVQTTETDYTTTVNWASNLTPLSCNHGVFYNHAKIMVIEL